MTHASHRPERLALRLLTVADAVANRLYGQRFNPLYQSGTIVAALYCRPAGDRAVADSFLPRGAPWESVARLDGQPLDRQLGPQPAPIRQRPAVVATLVHALRMFAQGRSRGARTMAWTSGGCCSCCSWSADGPATCMVWDVWASTSRRKAPACSTRCRCSPSP